MYDSQQTRTHSLINQLAKLEKSLDETIIIMVEKSNSKAKDQHTAICTRRLH